MPNSKKSADKNSGFDPKPLSGGNPQVPKGEGDEPVKAYIAAMPGWKRSLGERLDELIVRTVPDVHKAVKWNQPFYGHEGEAWLLAFRCYTKYVQMQFFRGTSLDPVPPKTSDYPERRYFDIHEDDDLDGDQLVSWIEPTRAGPVRRRDRVSRSSMIRPRGRSSPTARPTRTSGRRSSHHPA
jgi:hypothetical protein